MKANSVSLGKTTRPSVAGVLPRKRLFGLLARDNPVAWVTGPPGCGKTTLASSWLDHAGVASLWYQLDEGDADVATFFYYLSLAAASLEGERERLPLLTPEYQAGLGVFTRRYFERLYAQLKAPFAVVFDGYEAVPASSQLHEVLRVALETLPPGGRVLIVSRGDPPATLTRLRANQALSVIGWDELRLTRDEAGSIVAKRRPGSTAEAIDALYARTQGWAAGLVLMLEQAKVSGAIAEPPGLASRQLVFDYLAGEIFQKSDARTQQFLLHTAYLPEMTTAMARELSADEGTGDLLAGLNRNNYFVSVRDTHPEPVYQYHPMLRDFLQARAAESLPKERRRELQRASARQMEEAGRIEDAVALYRECHDWGEMARLIEAHAAALVAAGARRDHRALGRGASRRGAGEAPVDDLLGGGEPGAGRAARGPHPVRKGVRAVPRRRRRRRHAARGLGGDVRHPVRARRLRAARPLDRGGGRGREERGAAAVARGRGAHRLRHVHLAHAAPAAAARHQAVDRAGAARLRRPARRQPAPVRRAARLAHRDVDGPVRASRRADRGDAPGREWQRRVAVLAHHAEECRDDVRDADRGRGGVRESDARRPRDCASHRRPHLDLPAPGLRVRRRARRRQSRRRAGARPRARSAHLGRRAPEPVHVSPLAGLGGDAAQGPDAVRCKRRKRRSGWRSRSAARCSRCCAASRSPRSSRSAATSANASPTCRRCAPSWRGSTTTTWNSPAWSVSRRSRSRTAASAPGSPRCAAACSSAANTATRTSCGGGRRRWRACSPTRSRRASSPTTRGA